MRNLLVLAALCVLASDARTQNTTDERLARVVAILERMDERLDRLEQRVAALERREAPVQPDYRPWGQAAVPPPQKPPAPQASRYAPGALSYVEGDLASVEAWAPGCFYRNQRLAVYRPSAGHGYAGECRVLEAHDEFAVVELSRGRFRLGDTVLPRSGRGDPASVAERLRY